MLNPGANQYSGPACGAKKCFITAAADNNYYSQQRQAGWANEKSTFLRCLCVDVSMKHQGVTHFSNVH